MELETLFTFGEFVYIFLQVERELHRQELIRERERKTAAEVKREAESERARERLRAEENRQIAAAERRAMQKELARAQRSQLALVCKNKNFLLETKRGCG